MSHLSRVTRFCLLFVLMLCFSAQAVAEEEPLRTSLVNVSKSGGDSVYDKINGFLKKSGDIDSKNQKKVVATAKKLRVTKKDLRSGKWRKGSAKKLRQLLKAAELESLMLVDVYSKGRKAQLVVISPGGEEIASVEMKIKGGKISKSKARDMLKEAFKELVPAVRKAREDGVDEEAEEEEEEEEVEEEEEEEEEENLVEAEEEEEEEEEEEDGNVKKKAIAKKKAKYDAVAPGFKLKAGLLLGKRDLSMDAPDANFELNHESPFAGFAAQVDGVFVNFGDSGIGFSLFGAYAPFTTIFAENEEFASAFSQVGLELRYLKAFSSTLLVKVLAGAEANSITIDTNTNYTGTRYIGARLGAGFEYNVGPVILEATAVVVPILNTNNSDGAYGDPGFNLAFAPTAGPSFGITDDISAGLNYTFRLYNPEFPDAPKLSGATATSSDVMHAGVVSIGYRL